MATIWAVSTGDYSDYRVEGVFSSKKKAKAYLAVREQERYGGPIKLEQFAYDPDPPTLISTIAVYIDKAGNVLDCRTAMLREPLAIGFGGYYRERPNFIVSPGRPEIPNPPVYLLWTVQTDDAERAIKVANEKRAMLVAAGVWENTQETKRLLGIE